MNSGPALNGQPDVNLPTLATFACSHLLSSMSFQSVSQLMRSIKGVRLQALSSQVVDIYWRPCLEALCHMGATVAPLPLGTHIGLWYYQMVIKYSRIIYERQQEEIADLRRILPVNALQGLGPVDVEEVNIQCLVERHILLDEVNCDLIEPHININARELNLIGIGITRIPERLLNDQKLACYWQRLEALICNRNRLRVLPKSLGNLQALVQFCCHDNELEVLPESLGDMQMLRVLCCYSNHICSLPQSLENLQVLEIFDCSQNRLRILPAFMENIQSLQRLRCVVNHLQEVPESFVARFGDDWKNKTLASQVPIIEAQSVFAPQFAHARRKTDRRIRPAELEEVLRQAQEYTARL